MKKDTHFPQQKLETGFSLCLMFLFAFLIVDLFFLSLCFSLYLFVFSKSFFISITVMTSKFHCYFGGAVWCGWMYWFGFDFGCVGG